MVALTLCLGAGCGQPKPEMPHAAVVKEVVDDSEFEFEGEIISISSENISNFEVLDVFAGPEQKTATATLSFEYSDESGSYHVKGVVSYELAKNDRFKDPQFEEAVVDRLR